MEAVLKKNKGSIWTRQFTTIFIINILVNVSLYMVNTLIPKISAYLQTPVALIGVVVSTFAVTSLLSRPFVGVSSLYVKDINILRISVSILIVTYALFGMAGNIYTVIAGRLLQGIGMSFVGPLCLCLASNYLPKNRIASGVAVFSIGQASANAIGPSIGLAIAEKFGYGLGFFLPSGLMLLALILSLTLTSEAEPTREKFRFSLYTFLAREALVPCIIFFFLGGAYSCIVSYVVLYGESCGIANCGVFFTSYAIFVMLSRLVSGKLGEKYGLSYVIITAIICYGISFYFLSISHTTLMFILAGAVSALGYGVCQPSIQAVCMMRVDESRRAVAGNTCYFGVDMGYLIMPTVSGAIVSTVQQKTGDITQGYISMFRIMPIAILIALIIYILFGRKYEQTKETT